MRLRRLGIAVVILTAVACSGQGWTQMPGTALQTVCPANTAVYAFNSFCAGVAFAWSGGLADTSRNRLVVWGGGHTDYSGNELYALDVAAGTVMRLTDPSPIATVGSPSVLSDGNPNSRHTYNGLAYIAHADQYFAFGGSLAPGSAGDNVPWTFDPKLSKWSRWDLTASGGLPNSAYGDMVVYDPATKHVLIMDNSNLWSWTFETNAFTKLLNFPTTIYETAAIDEAARTLWVLGGNHMRKVDLGTMTASVLSIDPSCNALANTVANPGLTYDSAIQRVVGWAGGPNVYAVNPDATCMAYPFAAGPGDPQKWGTFGRFRYFPALDEFALVNDMETNSYVLHLGANPTPSPTPTPLPSPTPSPTPSPSPTPVLTVVVTPSSGSAGQSFNFQATGTGFTSPATCDFGPGVTVNSCTWNRPTRVLGNITVTGTTGQTNTVTIDGQIGSFIILGPSPTPTPTPSPTATPIPNGWASRSAGINTPGGLGSIVSVQSFDAFPTANVQQYVHYSVTDQSAIATDCAQGDGCSLKFETRPGAVEGNPGWLNYNFSPDLSRQFGEGSEFYVQYRERIDAGMLNIANFPGSAGFKLAIITEGDKPGAQANNCVNSPVEIVTTEHVSNGVPSPEVYVNCGGIGGSLAFLSQGAMPISLFEPFGTNFLDQPAAGCPHYDGRGISATEPTCWDFHPGEWATVQVHVRVGHWGMPDSTVELWMQHDGGQPQLITNAVDAALNSDGTGKGSNLYGKIVLLPYQTGLTDAMALGTVWYDDLIVSTRRIPDVGLAPNAPDSLTVSGSVLSWRVNSQNGTAQDDAGFLIERCTGTAAQCFMSPQGGFSQIGSTLPGVGAFTDTTQVPGNTYNYRVRATNAAGQSAYAVGQCFNAVSQSCGGQVSQ